LALDWAIAAIPLVVILTLAGRFLIARLGPPDLEHEDISAAVGASPDTWEDDEDPT
jgi:hypothetical protein